MSLTTRTLAAVCFVVAIAPAARADDSKMQCVAAAEEGQHLRNDGKLRAARERFATCMRDVCPGAVASECTKWFADVEGKIPTVVVTASDAAGKDLVDVKVTLDGEPFLDSISGRATPIDPGPHKLRFETAGAPPVEQTVVVREGDHDRAIHVTLAVPATDVTEHTTEPPPAEPSRGSLAPALVAGGIGVVALGAFGFLAVTGQKDYDDLKSRCSPSCTRSETDSVKTKFLVADVALGVGVVALAVATYFVIARPGASSEKTARVRVLPGGIAGTF